MDNKTVACLGESTPVDLVEMNRQLDRRIVLIGDHFKLSRSTMDALIDAARHMSLAIHAVPQYPKFHNEEYVTQYDGDDYPGYNPDCKNDHGERTNYKLKDQPFYQRGRNGKMRTY